MQDPLTKNLVRVAAGIFIAGALGTGLFFAGRHVSRKMSANYCANVDVPDRCPGDVCSHQDKLNVFRDCMAERGHFFN